VRLIKGGGEKRSRIAAEIRIAADPRAISIETIVKLEAV
jgi:hypothetical protein